MAPNALWMIHAKAEPFHWQWWGLVETGWIALLLANTRMGGRAWQRFVGTGAYHLQNFWVCVSDLIDFLNQLGLWMPDSALKGHS